MRARAAVGEKPGKRSRAALVCAGGGITGAVYEIGCLRALEDLLDRSVLDFDLYVGVSGGAFVSALLAGGVSPREMYDEVAAVASSPFGIAPPTLFRLGPGEFVRRSLRGPRVLADALGRTLQGKSSGISDVALSLFELLPAGLLDNSGIQEYLANVFKSRGRNDTFRDLGGELYVVAVDLDSGDAVPFGEPTAPEVPVSRAVQASTAMPGLYRPVRIAGRDYLDGGVKKTAHINLAIKHGAELVVCINPIVPILNDGVLNGHLSGKGITYVLDQALRIMLHGRMQYGLERYRSEHPDVDILVVQPTRDDMRMFRYNIMRYSARRVVAEHGYRSLLASFRQNRRAYGRLLGRHGIRLEDPRGLPELPHPHAYRSAVGRTLSGSLDVLGSRLRGGASRRRSRRGAGRAARKAAL